MWCYIVVVIFARSFLVYWNSWVPFLDLHSWHLFGLRGGVPTALTRKHARLAGVVWMCSASIDDKIFLAMPVVGACWFCTQGVTVIVLLSDKYCCLRCYCNVFVHTWTSQYFQEQSSQGKGLSASCWYLHQLYWPLFWLSYCTTYRITDKYCLLSSLGSTSAVGTFPSSCLLHRTLPGMAWCGHKSTS